MLIRSWMIAFSLGIFLCGFIPQLPQSNHYLLLLIIPVLSLRLRFLYLSGAFLLGLCWFLIWAQAGVAQLLPKQLESKDIWIRGIVDSLPQQNDSLQRFEFKITKLCPSAESSQCHFEQLPKQKQRFLLSDYQRSNLTTDFLPGQHWQLKVRLKRPHGFANPGGFDYQGWLMQKKIGGVGYIRDAPRLLLEPPARLFNLQALRVQFRQKLEAMFPDTNMTKRLNNINLVKALTIGDRYNITDREWELFTATGTNHLIVISGLHVGLVALMVYRLGVSLMSIFTASLLCIPAQRSGAALAALAAFFYASLAGFSLPAQRAFIMVGVFMLAQLLYRNTSSLNSYCLALVLVLLLAPLAPQSSGFWLSFGAVGVLLLLAAQSPDKLSHEITLWQKGILLIKSQSLLFIGLLPLMLIFFQQQSLLAPLVNLFAIPFVGIIVIPLCLSGLVLIWLWPSLASKCFMLADYALGCLKATLQYVIDHSPTSLVELPQLSWPALGVIIIGALLILCSKRTSRRSFGIFCLLPLAFPDWVSTQPGLQAGELRLTILDVGQGLAVVLQTQQHSLIYDAGPAYSPKFDAGKGILVPYLRAQNIRKIDTIIISHEDADHAGGLPALTSRYTQAEYFSPDLSLFAEDISAQLCTTGQEWQWDGIHFSILHPDLAKIDRYSSNNSSCVLKVTIGQTSVLLTGDIEKSAERRLLRNANLALESTILIAPHHGSNTSSTLPFINRVKAQYTIFSSGYLSRFNHPHPLVVARYQKLKTQMLNTSNTGAITFLLSSSEVFKPPELYRTTHKRYWSML